MSQYADLLKYIGYFADESISFSTWQAPDQRADDVVSLGYPNYDARLREFVEATYQAKVLDQDYLDYLTQHVPDPDKLVASIDTADFKLLRAILTYYIRQERFCEGTWAQAAKEKIFLKLLRRLASITQEGGTEG